jgi:hypothetical protein
VRHETSIAYSDGFASNDVKGTIMPSPPPTDSCRVASCNRACENDNAAQNLHSIRLTGSPAAMSMNSQAATATS